MDTQPYFQEELGLNQEIVHWSQLNQLLPVEFDLRHNLDSLYPGGVLRFGSDGGVPLKPPNQYLSLRVILAEKVPIIKGF